MLECAAMFDSYLNLVLKRPVLCICGLMLVVLSLAWFAQDFRLDASSDSLVVEGDPDLEFSRQMNERYGTSDFVFITYKPDQELFLATSLATLATLKAELEALARVESIDSIFSVPLFKVANVSLNEIADNIITLESAGVDLEAARADLSSSDAYRNVLLSEDGETAALVVNFPNGVTDEELHADINQIRSILDTYRDNATIFMGGVPMIADDLITFVKNDLINFGLAIFIFIIFSLAYLFRKVRYVLIPLLCCGVTILSVTGLLGLFDWPVTVISSNFISLLLIITISLTVHLMVRYRELEAAGEGDSHQERIKLVLRSMILPCTYTSFTTMVAFGSLVISGIPPIISFGWMMVLGVFTALVFTFLLFPAVLVLLAENKTTSKGRSLDITPLLANLTTNHGKLILVFAAALFVFSFIGMSRLKVENSFIDYFDESTEIYQGMVAIDQNMGGTTPLDVIIDLSVPNPFDSTNAGDDLFGNDEYDEWEDDEWADEDDPVDEDAYWFTSDKMARIIAIHDFLDGLPETGKVLSLGTILQIAYDLNEGEALNSIELAVLYSKIPQEYKETLLQPYVSIDNDQARFSIRVMETDPNLIRGELLKTIRTGLSEEFGFSPEQIHLTGMLVLYNNMLNSLFESQILTLSLVLAVILVMFSLLFRSIKLAVIGIIPNILAAATVLGLMGWLGIPLDMMTITIAAISVGIGVDNTIHYIHRFKSQFPKQQNYQRTMTYCHGSIGQAMYFTSFTIVAGFSILVLSNFVPTMYFGLLTSLAMMIALLGALTLLPQLLITFKPLGPEKA